MTTTLAQLERKVARLEAMLFRRATTGIVDPIAGAVPEHMIIDEDGPDSAAFDGTPFPGCIVVIPPGCQVCLGNPDQDPQLITGVGSQVMMRAIEPHLAKVLTGGVLLFDPTLGTGGLIISPTGVDVIGVLTNNGESLP